MPAKNKIKNKVNSEDVKNNLGLARKIAWSYYYLTRQDPRLEIDDLINWAVLGLHYALEKFDPSLGYKFSTFATPYIRGILLNRWNRSRKEIFLAKQRGEKITEYPLVDKGDGLYADFATVNGRKIQEQITDRIHAKQVLQQFLGRLSPRDREVVSLMIEDRTHEEVAAKMGISTSRVSQIWLKALFRARKYWGVEVETSIK